MKQQIINLKKKLMLVERSDDNLLEDFKIFEMLVNHNVKKTIGKLTNIKDKDVSMYLDYCLVGKAIPHFKDYTNPNHVLPSAKESFFSKLSADNIYFKNSLGKQEDYVKRLLKSIGFKYNPGYKSWDNVGNSIGTPLLITDLPPCFSKEEKEWQEAQSKVWNKNNCWLFEIISIK